MSSLTPVARLLALSALLGLVVPSAVLEAQQPPDFSGVWEFNQKRSDDLRSKIEEAVGPDATTGDIKKDLVRIWIRRWLLGVIDDPDSRFLTVEQTDKDFKTGLGDEISIYYFGREAASRGPLGGTLRVSVKWEGTQLRLEEKGKDGRITALYTLLPPGDTLLVAYLLEHKTLIKPLEVAMFFNRDEETE
jgi:hypothetical protein